MQTCSEGLPSQGHLTYQVSVRIPCRATYLRMEETHPRHLCLYRYSPPWPYLRGAVAWASKQGKDGTTLPADPIWSTFFLGRHTIKTDLA